MEEHSFISGAHIQNFHVDGHLEVFLNFEKNSYGTYICNIEGDGELNFRVNFENGSSWTFLWLNKSNRDLSIEEHITLGKHTNIKMNYGELSEGKHIKNSVYEFLGNDSQLNVKGASIVYGKLNWDLKALHHAKRSYANLDNHAIVLENGLLNLEVTGQIDKGFSGSETHQMTRVMNFGEAVNAVVFPKLLIDENDVAASHAATVGQPNEEHIYYLQARGISRNEALKLLMKGYLLPITNDIENETVKTELLDEIDSKVESQWT